MQIHLITVGHLKSGPEKQLYDYYAKRLGWKLKLKEFPNKLHQSEHSKRLATEIDKILPRHTTTIGLDETGKLLTSSEFAQLLSKLQLQGVRNVGFLIGGADGLPDQTLAKCSHKIAFGRLTWPHLLVRGLLMEQLYRAQQILANHPYHRD